MNTKHTGGWRLKVRETAEAQHLDREGLAVCSGLPLNIIAPLWENERADTTVNTLITIANALQVSLFDILKDNTGNENGSSPA